MATGKEVVEHILALWRSHCDSRGHIRLQAEPIRDPTPSHTNPSPALWVEGAPLSPEALGPWCTVLPPGLGFLTNPWRGEQARGTTVSTNVQQRRKATLHNQG